MDQSAPAAAIVRDKIIVIVCSDVAGQIRGKGFPAEQYASRLRFGVGWTPTNVMINCFGRIPATPFGSTGDLMLVPAPEGEFRIDFGDGVAEHIVLGDIRTLDGQPWDCCLRSFLKRSLDDLEAEAGLRLMASFEHEFWLDNAEERPGDAYAFSTLRGLEPFIGDVLGALRANGVRPDTFLPEFGPRQFEVTLDPAIGLGAADHAVKLREICRSVARRHGHHVSFSPVVTRGIVGNGVHIHFSLLDRDGAPASYTPGEPGNLSTVQASFAAGILKHARALCALTAPSVISYERLKPKSWSAHYVNIADRDREAMLRICPYPEVAGVDVGKRFNLEFRAADAAASPYLQLGALVRAGLEGIRQGLPAPELSTGDLGALSAEERKARGIGVLPGSLGEALDALATDPVVMGWLGPTLGPAYVMHKRGEIAMTDGVDLDELCARYAKAY